MAYKRISGLPVAEGGTSLTTLTAHSVQVGNGTSAVTQLAVGGTGTLLVGAASADPAFGTSANGDFTFTSSTAGTARTLTVTNTDNTNAASHARLFLTTGGASGGEPLILYRITGVQDYIMGTGNPTNNTFNICTGSALGSNIKFKMQTTGEINYPGQPGFGVRNAALTSKTGDGTAYSFVWGTTEWNQDSTLASNGISAPVAGNYLVTVVITMNGLTSSHTQGAVTLVATARTYQIWNGNPFACQNATSGLLTVSGSAIIAMSASDTATVTVTVSGGTKAVGFPVSDCYFTCSLIS